MPKRRRGDNLDEQIFQATYDLMTDIPREKLTFSAIAKQANTSRSVLYRHWDTPLDLIIDAIMYEISQTEHPFGAPTFDYGSLKNNLVHLGEEFMTTTQTPPAKYIRPLFNMAQEKQQKRASNQILKAVEASNLQLIDHVIELAIQNHELSHEPSQTVKLAFFDLLRSSSMIGEPVSNDWVTRLVNEVIYPAMRFQDEQTKD